LDIQFIPHDSTEPVDRIKEQEHFTLRQPDSFMPQSRDIQK
jgi:hypothetical protein